MFLMCHAIELALKSYLLLKGVPEEDLRKDEKDKKGLGHNLAGIFDEAVRLGFNQDCAVAPILGHLLPPLTTY